MTVNDNFHLNTKWLQLYWTHPTYKNKWVALCYGNLIDFHEDKNELQKRLKQKNVSQENLVLTKVNSGE